MLLRIALSIVGSREESASERVLKDRLCAKVGKGLLADSKSKSCKALLADARRLPDLATMLDAGRMLDTGRESLQAFASDDAADFGDSRPSDSAADLISIECDILLVMMRCTRAIKAEDDGRGKG